MTSTQLHGWGEVGSPTRISIDSSACSFIYGPPQADPPPPPQAQSVQDADGWAGEPKEWAAPDSAAQRLSALSQVGPLARGKQWLAAQLAGEYDAAVCPK